MMASFDDAWRSSRGFARGAIQRLPRRWQRSYYDARATVTRLREEVAVYQAIESVVRQPGRLVFGPWRSEIGFEVLYWIPFLKAIRAEFRIDPSRVTAVSRGGCADWYQDVAGEYVDALSLVSPEDYKKGLTERVERTRTQKHFEVETADDELLRRALATTGSEYNARAVLHPSLMYRLFSPLWNGAQSAEEALKRLRFERFAAPERSVELQRLLPTQYFAAKFYFRESFPETPENVRAVRDLLTNLRQHAPVVLLDTGISLDEHTDFTPEADLGLRLNHMMTPANNLELQSHVVAGASAFFCTYGGFAHLAPFYGVPTIALYSNGNFVRAHLDLATRAADALGTGLLTVLDVTRMRLWSPPAGALTP
jgi:hypothetical protein